MHILSCKLLVRGVLSVSSLIYTILFISFPSLQETKMKLFFSLQITWTMLILCFNIILVRGGKKQQKYLNFSLSPVNKFIPLLRTADITREKLFTTSFSANFYSCTAATFSQFLALFPLPTEQFFSVILIQFSSVAPLNWQVILWNDPCSSK